MITASEQQDIVVYSTVWCPDCKRAKKFLGEQRVPYVNVDIEQDPKAMALVQKLNDGKRVIPTIVFPDGSVLIEPSNAELAEKLGLQTSARQSYYDAIVVGGGPAGLTAALYMARENIETLVIEKGGLGGQAGATAWKLWSSRTAQLETSRSGNTTAFLCSSGSRPTATLSKTSSSATSAALCKPIRT